jgi:hypothetical protein
MIIVRNMKPINSLCGKNIVYFNVKIRNIYTYHCALKG